MDGWQRCRMFEVVNSRTLEMISKGNELDAVGGEAFDSYGYIQMTDS